MADKKPSLNEFYKIEEKRLSNKLDAVRWAIKHAGEKGRTMEQEVASFLREILPQEYGISTGFIVYQDEEAQHISSQLDIIIYDSLRCAPLISLGTCDVFPLEAVYGYVEVKSSINKTVIRDCFKKNALLRTMTKRGFWDPYGGSPPTTEYYDEDWLPIRAFVFGFEGKGIKGKKIQGFANSIKNIHGEIEGSHIHGILIADQAYFSSYPIKDYEGFGVDEDEFDHTTENPLVAFKICLLKALATFERFPQNHAPAVDRYHYDLFKWKG